MYKVKFIVILIILVNLIILKNISKYRSESLNKSINIFYNLDTSNINLLFMNYYGINLNKWTSLLILIILKILYIMLLPLLPLIFYIINIHNKNRSNYFYCMLNISDSKIKELFKINTKYNWFRFFKKYNIKTPEILGIINNNKLNVISKSFDNKKKYYYKPDIGFQGKRIYYINYEEFLNKNIKEDYVIQDKVLDNKYPNNPRLIRYITVFNKKTNSIDDLIFRIYYGKRNNDITNSRNSNHTFDCDSFNCKYFDNGEKILINKIRNQLRDLHFNYFKSIDNIGWDLMISKEYAYVLEGNFCNGTQLSEKYIKKYNSIKN
jgi:hypothetical protein